LVAAAISLVQCSFLQFLRLLLSPLHLVAIDV
jgi:hypothetical protein